MRKYIKLLLIFVSIFIASNNVFAIDTNQLGSISGVIKENNLFISSVDIEMYEIANFDQANNFMFLDKYKDFNIYIDKKIGLENYTDEIISIIKNNKLPYTNLVETNNKGEFNFNNLHPGLYLIKLSDNANNAIKMIPVLLTIPYDNNGNINYDAKIYPKIEVSNSNSNNENKNVVISNYTKSNTTNKTAKSNTPKWVIEYVLSPFGIWLLILLIIITILYIIEKNRKKENMKTQLETNIKHNIEFIKLLLIGIAVVQLFIFNNVSALSITIDNTKTGNTDTNSKLVTNKASIEVDGVDSEDTFKAYKIIDTYYNSTSNEIIYEFTNDFKTFIADSSYSTLTIEDYQSLTSGDITNGSTITTSSLDTLVSDYITYIKENNLTGSSLTGNGQLRSLSLQAGSYVIIPTTSLSIYATMVGNVEIKEQNGEWILDDTTIIAKKSAPGVLAKSVNTKGVTSGSFNINEEYNYILTGTVPAYPTNAKSKNYIIKDTMSNGITFLGMSHVVVKDGTTTLNVTSDGKVLDASSNEVAQIAYENNELTITFNYDYLKSNNVTISYGVKLNASATLGSTGNINSATLTYTNNPYARLSSDTVTDSSLATTTVYTYGIEVFAYSGSEKDKPLSGVVFEVYTDQALTNKIGEVETDENGYAQLGGVKNGSYYLKEIKTSAGHNVIKTPIKVVVKDAGAIVSTNEGYYISEISNSKTFGLPFTGGSGTMIYTIFGTLIGVIAIVLYANYRRKTVNE